MNKIIAIKYVLVFVFIICGVAAAFFSPDLYKLTHLHFGPGLAFLCACAGTLIWDSVQKSEQP